MKKFIHALCLTALLCTSLSVQAQNACLTKEQAQNITFSWTDAADVTHQSNLAETAKDPRHIIALLKEVYTNPNVPGPWYNGYKADGTTRENEVYYGPIYGTVKVGSGDNATYNDVATGWNITSCTKPYNEGYTVLLLAVKNEFTDEALSGATITNNKLVEFIGGRIDSVFVITDGLRMNGGTMFSIKGTYNRFFYLSKGKSRVQNPKSVTKNGAVPFYKMFEEFSPYEEGDTYNDVTDFYNLMMRGESMPIEHDCNSVFGLKHYFSMSGRQGKTAYDMTGLNLFIPDHRMQYWTTEKYQVEYKEGNSWKKTSNKLPLDARATHPTIAANVVYLNANISSPEFIANGKTTIPASWYNATFTNYNQNFPVVTFMYAIKLTAERTEQADADGNYTVTLKWGSTWKKNTGDDRAQDYYVYRVVNGKITGEPIYTTQSADNELTWTEPAAQQDAGYMLTYVVLGKPLDATYDPIPSNFASVAIPGKNPEERLALSIEGKHESTYVPNEEINKYANYMVLNNGIGNSITKAMLQSGTKIILNRTDKGAHAILPVATITITAVNAGNCTWTLTYDHQDHADASKYGPTSGTFTFAANGDVQFNNLELCDQFSASTQRNDHQSDYKYQIEIRNLTENAFYVDGTGYDHAHSNEADVLVYKTEHTLLQASYTQAQVDADIVNDGSLAQLTPGVTMEFTTDNDRNVLNYHMYRDATSTGVYGQRTTDGYIMAHNADGTTTSWTAGGQARLVDMPPTAGAFDYVPVIETYRDDNSGARNTYGADQKRASVARVTVQETKVASSTYTFTDEGLNCRTYATGLKIKADVPDGMELEFIRVWHRLPEGYAHENKDEANRGRLNQEQRCYLYDIDSFLGNGAPAEVGTSLGQDCVIAANKEVWVWDHFGALDIMENSSVDPFNVQYVVRLYCTVNRPAGAPRRAEGDAANWVIVEEKAEAEFTSTNVVTSVAGVEVAPQVTGVRYINLAGQSSSRPWPGINLVVKTLNNGTTSTSKAVF